MRGAPVARQWYRDAKVEHESDGRSLVFTTAFLNATVKRARDEEALTRVLAASPRPLPRPTLPKRTKKRKDDGNDDRDDADRGSSRTGESRAGAGGCGSNDGVRGGRGSSESAPS